MGKQAPTQKNKAPAIGRGYVGAPRMGKQAPTQKNKAPAIDSGSPRILNDLPKKYRSDPFFGTWDKTTVYGFKKKLTVVKIQEKRANEQLTC